MIGGNPLLLDSVSDLAPQAASLPPIIGGIIVLCDYPLLVDGVLDIAPQAGTVVVVSPLLQSGVL